MLSLMPWRQQKDLDRFKGEIDRMFNEFFDWHTFQGSIDGSEWMPAVDISETGREVIVNAELPGMDPKDIDISLNGRLLTIKGERKQEHEEKDKNYHRVERRYGAFTRAFELPADVEADKVEARYKKGVLKLKLRKTREASVKKIEVKTG